MITAFDKLSDGNKWGASRETSVGAGMSIRRRTRRDLRSGAEVSRAEGRGCQAEAHLAQVLSPEGGWPFPGTETRLADTDKEQRFPREAEGGESAGSWEGRAG